MKIKNFVEKEVDGYKKHKKAIIFAVFLLIIFSLIYFAFFQGKIGNITSKVIGSNKANLVDSIKINADLTQPNDDLIVRGEIDRIEMKIQKINDFFYVGKEKFDLGRLDETEIVILYYDGDLIFNKQNILELKGKASQVLINGVSATSADSFLPIFGSGMKVQFKNAVRYKYIKLDGVSLSPLTYQTLGIIELNDGKMNINVNGEEIKLGEFFGDIEIQEGAFKLEGNTEKLEIEGVVNIEV